MWPKSSTPDLSDVCVYLYFIVAVLIVPVLFSTITTRTNDNREKKYFVGAEKRMSVKEKLLVYSDLVLATNPNVAKILDMGRFRFRGQYI